jgi:hypothetical protein
LKVNIDLRLYYDPKRPGRSAKYIGFYSEKAVRGIGILSKVARVERIKGELRVVEGPALSSRELARVAEAMDSAVVYGWNIDQGGYFFLTEWPISDGGMIFVGAAGRLDRDLEVANGSRKKDRGRERSASVSAGGEA